MLPPLSILLVTGSILLKLVRMPLTDPSMDCTLELIELTRELIEPTLAPMLSTLALIVSTFPWIVATVSLMDATLPLIALTLPLIDLALPLIDLALALIDLALSLMALAVLRIESTLRSMLPASLRMRSAWEGIGWAASWMLFVSRTVLLASMTLSRSLSIGLTWLLMAGTVSSISRALTSVPVSISTAASAQTITSTSTMKGSAGASPSVARLWSIAEWP